MAKKNLRNGKLGVIIPCLNEALNIDSLITEISKISKKNRIEIYPIIIDDGSTDDTYQKSLNCLKREFDEGFNLQSFIRNFGKESAILAGLKQSKSTGCACTALIDADFQDNPQTLLLMYEKWQSGHQLISCIREKRYKADPFLKTLTSNLFYLVFEKSSKFRFKRGIGDFRLMDNTVVNYILQIPERIRFFKGLIEWVGVETVSYTHLTLPTK